MKTPKSFVIAFFVALAIASFSGCESPQTSFEIPANDKTLAAMNFKSGGGAAPAEMTVEEKSYPVTFWLESEAGKGKPDFSFPFQSALSNGEVKTRKIVIKTAPAFGPPSAGEKAAGIAVGALTIGAICSLALAGLFAYLQHYKAAGFAGAGAGISLAGAKFMSDDNALLILGGFVIAALAIFASWHFVKDKIPKEFGGTAKR